MSNSKPFKAGSEVLFIKEEDCNDILNAIKSATKTRSLLHQDAGWGDNVLENKKGINLIEVNGTLRSWFMVTGIDYWRIHDNIR